MVPRRSIFPGVFSGLAVLALCTGPVAARQDSQSRGSDLDQFMAVVLARRDENWKKLQQYVLDERETADFLGPGRVRLFGLDREYTWYIRDGIFVRSPVRVDRVALGEADRRRAEQEWIDQERSRDRDKAASATESAKGAGGADASSGQTAAGVEALLQATREPKFVSAAYFLRFKFEAGHYAFVGREPYEGRQVLRIEYYPSKLFAGENDGASTEKPDPTEERLSRQMNKVALVTLWIEPAEHQIVQYRFDNVGLDFLPGRSMVRVNGFGATMKMGQPFAGIWLPQGIDASGGFTLANGTYDAHYKVTYLNYRIADVQVKIR
jgi:hypothetical protein